MEIMQYIETYRQWTHKNNEMNLT